MQISRPKQWRNIKSQIPLERASSIVPCMVRATQTVRDLASSGVDFGEKNAVWTQWVWTGSSFYKNLCTWFFIINYYSIYILYVIWQKRGRSLQPIWVLYFSLPGIFSVGTFWTQLNTQVKRCCAALSPHVPAKSVRLNSVLVFNSRSINAWLFFKSFLSSLHGTSSLPFFLSEESVVRSMLGISSDTLRPSLYARSLGGLAAAAFRSHSVDQRLISLVTVQHRCASSFHSVQRGFDAQVSYPIRI
jgi:hypothetical protein